MSGSILCVECKRGGEHAKGCSKPKGRHLLRVFVGSEWVIVDGKRVRKRKYSASVYEGTISQARTEIARRHTKVADNEYVLPADQTLGEFLKFWLEEVKTGKVSERSHTFYETRLAPAIADLGHLRLDKLTREMIQKWVNRLPTTRKYSGNTVRKTYGTLKMALNYAVDHKMIAKNPCERVDLPLKRLPGIRGKKKRVTWTADQVQLYLERTVTHPLYALWHLLLNTGLRPGEAFALQWPDFEVRKNIVIDTDGKQYIEEVGYITVRQAVVELKPKIVVRHGREVKQLRYGIDVPKTPQSRRTIPLPKETTAVLLAHRKAQAAMILKAGPSFKRNDYIFPTETGDYWTIQPVGNRWETCVKHCTIEVDGEIKPGVPKMPLYHCRHTHATLLLKNGVPVKVVSERLGHANVQMTLTAYQDVLPDMQDDAVKTFERIMRRA